MPPKEKSKELKHRNIICLKLTDIELEILNQAASSVGISRSEYLRRLFLNKPIQISYEVVADIKLLRELVRQYGKIGSNRTRSPSILIPVELIPRLWKMKSINVSLTSSSYEKRC